MPLGLRAPPPATFRGEGEPLKRTLLGGPSQAHSRSCFEWELFFVLSVCLRGLAPVQTRCSPHPLLASFLEPGCVSREGCHSARQGTRTHGRWLSALLSTSCLPAPRQEGMSWMGSFLGHLHFGCLFLGVLLPAPWEALL